LTGITYTVVLDVGRETAETLARLLHGHRERLGTRKNTRALGVFRHPVRKPQGRELNLEQQTFNKVIRGIHAVAERANALLKVTFKALRRVSLDPASITRITRAALVLLQLEHGRTT
jgi:hypothetical protein